MENPSADSNRTPAPKGRPAPFMLVAMIGLAMIVGFLYWRSALAPSEISVGFFRQQWQAGNVTSVTIEKLDLYGTFAKVPDAPLTAEDKKKGKTAGEPLKEKFHVVLSREIDEAFDKELRDKLGADYIARTPPEPGGSLAVASIITTVLLIVATIWFFNRLRDQMAGGGGFLTSFGKSPARRFEAGKQRVTFADVAGLESVKRDLAEIIEFLKSPAKFQKLGGRIPKGTLLMGPPGTGKTLLAKAVAGEAGVPFLSINGSEFIQMFVGVGASRVRDLFRVARESAPCILFIDEIDAVGRVRGAGFGGGHDEREQTLNQILSEMDGFSPTESVIVLAATNRPDVLDPALLRPGRFDRHVTVDRPNLTGREAIFKVHTREVPLAADVDLRRLARGSVGLTGADIRNLVNEAALWAARHDKNHVDMDDFEVARDRVLMGPKRDEVLSEEEKVRTAYHEAGHALLAWLLPGGDKVHKVTIIPRGRALGVTQMLPEEDRLTISQSQLLAMLAIALGGRAADKLVFDEFSAGAEDDLRRSTDLARRMITRWGMSERLGPVSYRLGDENPFLGKEYHELREFSEHTAQVIDEEVSRLLHAAELEAKTLLERRREKLDILAKALVEREVLEDDEIADLIGPEVARAPYASQKRRTADAGMREGQNAAAMTSSFGKT